MSDGQEPIGQAADGDQGRLMLDQYRLYLETTEGTSSRRLQTNAFFLTFNTALLAGVSFVFSDVASPNTKLFAMGAIVAGLTLSVVWQRLLKAYQRINTAKFEVLQEMEKHLPAQVIGHEYRLLTKAREEDPSAENLSTLESRIPQIMMWMYAFVLLVGGASFLVPEMSVTTPHQVELRPVELKVQTPASTD